MIDVKRLLDEADSLPWRFDGDWWISGDRNVSMFAPTNAALIVHAVNRLPDYEAAVDALEALTGGALSTEVFDRIERGLGALRRLRGGSR